MMNIPMKDFGLNNIVQNHGVLSETLPLIESPPPPHDYEYLCHPTSIVHQPQHLHTNIPQSGVSGDCISSQQSHNNGVVHYGNQGPSTTYSLMSFSERESVTTSLYNLVTTTPVLTTATIINPPTYGPHILSTHETVSSIPNQGGVGHRDTDGVSSTSPSDHRYDELGNLRARNESFPALHNNYPPGHERKMNYQHHFNSSQSSHHRKRKRQSR
ncbi:hypothetical protein Fcan01_12346 [Folsomia candida]|uniref:Uncharacterized protein n=2 Tax=Folsomia candida TaxID=158441 RepID=A0A226E702_FOLCA|nr:hypothetical protein Fcan01_12346 [Folsomia candida]